MKKMAVFLYKRICILGIPLFCRKQVETDLTGLHPGERVEYIKTEYYVKKITLFLTVLFVGAFLGLVVKVNGKRDAVLSEGGVVHRGSYQSGEQKLFLKADDGEKESSFLIEVSPRELTKEETEQLFDSFLHSSSENLKTLSPESQKIPAATPTCSLKPENLHPPGRLPLPCGLPLPILSL